MAVVVDAFSRRMVLGGSMANHLRNELVDALDMAVAHRRPVLGLVHRSDHGAQHASLAAFRAAVVGSQLAGLGG